VGGQAQALQRVLSRFLQTYRNGEPALLLHGGPEGRDALRQACHSLRGACGAVGAMALVEELQALELRLADTALAATAAPAALACDEHLRGFVRSLVAAAV